MPDLSDRSPDGLAAQVFELCKAERELAAELRAIDAELARRKQARAESPPPNQRNDYGGSGPKPPRARRRR
jgi:hypothetical protein